MSNFYFGDITISEPLKKCRDPRKNDSLVTSKLWKNLVSIQTRVHL